MSNVNLFVMALEMTLKQHVATNHRNDQVVVDLGDSKLAELISIWTKFNVINFDPRVKNNADCVVCSTPITEDNIEGFAEMLVSTSKTDQETAFICITDHTVNVFEWFNISQVYTYNMGNSTASVGYFNIMVLNPHHKD